MRPESGKLGTRVTKAEAGRMRRRYDQLLPTCGPQGAQSKVSKDFQRDPRTAAKALGPAPVHLVARPLPVTVSVPPIGSVSVKNPVGRLPWSLEGYTSDGAPRRFATVVGANRERVWIGPGSVGATGTLWLLWPAG